jgi:DNA-directed RNA polymerase specialized sigma24 family protein
MAESVPLPDSNHERAVQVTELFRSHNRTLVRFLQAKLQDPQEAREIAQEAYVRLGRSAFCERTCSRLRPISLSTVYVVATRGSE